MMHKKQNIFALRLALSVLFLFFLGETCFGFDDPGKTDGPSRLTRRSPVKKRKPLREEMNKIVQEGSSEYAMVSGAKLPEEEEITLEEEERLLTEGFQNPEDFLKLFNFYRRSLITRFGCLDISSLTKGANPSFRILFKKDKYTDQKPLIEMLFMQTFSEAECQKVAKLNTRLKSISSLIKPPLENDRDQIFLKLFFRTFDGVLESKMEEGSVQFYANLESGDGIWKIILRDLKNESAIYFRYHPETLK
ncbi:MAG: hypothetical protein JSS34_00765 [Proteobacteria bacterium]|nr:hypothetical protein [Pseudomonadota bacterium]